MDKPKLFSEQKKPLKIMQKQEARKKMMMDETERQIQLQLKNKADIDQVWYEIMSKNHNTTTYVEKISGSFEGLSHNKDKEVYGCISHIEDMAELKAKYEASHGEYISHLFENLLKKMRECHWDYKNRQQKLIEIRNKNNDELQKEEVTYVDDLKLFMVNGDRLSQNHYHKNRYEVEVTARTGIDVIQSRDIQILSTIGDKLEIMWNKFVNTFNKCLSVATVSKKAYNTRSIKYAQLKETLLLQKSRINKLRNVIAFLRFKLLKEKFPPKISMLIPPYKSAIVSYRNRFNEDLTSDKKVITDLTKKITEIQKYLVDKRQKGEDIFRLLALCRPLETIAELVENFQISNCRVLRNEDMKNLKTFNFPNTFINDIAVLWERFARIELSRNILKDERDFLIAENGVFQKAINGHGIE